MTSNDVIALIVRYFTEFVYNDLVKQLPQFQNLLLTSYDHIKTNYDNSVWRAYVHRWLGA